MFCFTLYFQKDVAEYIVVLHCIIVSFWNLKSLSSAFIRCTTRCHLLCHSLSCFITRCHSLPIFFIRCHSLSLIAPLVVTRCTARCQSLSFVVPLVVIRCLSLYYSLSLDVPLVCLHVNDRLFWVKFQTF